MKLVHSLIAAALASSATTGQAAPTFVNGLVIRRGCARRFRRHARQRRPARLLLGHLLRPAPQRLVGAVGPRARRRHARLRDSCASLHARCRSSTRGAISNFQVRKTLYLPQRRRRRSTASRLASRRAARRRVRSRGHRRASAYRNSARLRRVRPSVYEFTPRGQLVRAYRDAGESDAAQRRRPAS